MKKVTKKSWVRGVVCSAAVFLMRLDPKHHYRCRRCYAESKKRGELLDLVICLAWFWFHLVWMKISFGFGLGMIWVFDLVLVVVHLVVLYCVVLGQG